MTTLLIVPYSLTDWRVVSQTQTPADKHPVYDFVSYHSSAQEAAKAIEAKEFALV